MIILKDHLIPTIIVGEEAFRIHRVMWCHR